MTVALVGGRLVAGGGSGNVGTISRPSASIAPGLVTSFHVFPSPPAGSLGLQMLLRVEGVGSAQTELFDVTDTIIQLQISLESASFSGRLGDEGRAYLIGEGRSLTGADQPAALCCLAAHGQGEAKVSVGRYRLAFQAPANVHWLISLSTFHGPPLSVQTFSPSPGAIGDISVAYLVGIGDQRTLAFHIPASRGHPPVVADFGFGGGDAKFWVVAAGRPFDETAPPVNACPDASGICSGAFGLSLAEGDYFVVVRATSWWSLGLSVA